MRLHTLNRRATQNATKAAKLRGIRIGGGRLTPPDGYKGGAALFPAQVAPARIQPSSILASLRRRSKRGDRVYWIDVLSTGAYVRTADGSIRKVRA